ncbi:MAG: ECF-type sigma factor [Marinicellaceae bacterium]
MTTSSITVLLEKLGQGDKSLLDDIYSELYEEIKAVAYNQIKQLKTGQTITPTVVANECYIKLSKTNNINVSNKRHLLNYLAKSMRLLLIDILRQKSSNKRNHLITSQSFSMVMGDDDINLEWLEIDLLLKKIERINVEYSELLEYKLIFNLTFKEISELIDKSERQVIRIWNNASALITALSKEHKNNEPKNGSVETSQ